MNKIICDAIRSKQCIKFDYDGHSRIVEPHAYGIHKSTGNEVLRAYQIEGYSSSGNLPQWRLYEGSKIINIVTMSDTFDSPRQGYRENDSDMSHIYCQVDR